ncbi:MULTISPECIES: sigma-70 family RNA polymerase sigma factor [Planococcus]|nr:MULTISPECIES: sigma-70 family RNA polymerase sigma factor [Planococcus]MDJ0333383.1 sigma-70 family RNA polymerase sigma factor [Planococcus sp. S3-L1]
MVENDGEYNLNEEQIEQIMDEHGEYLLRFIYVYVKDWSTAEDILQEVFVAYYLKSHQFESRSSLKTYLSKMAINRCHDHLRSWKNRRIVFSDAMTQWISSSKSTEKTYEHQVVRSDLIKNVMELPITYRESIILYYYQQLTMKEISELLACPENTIKTRLRRAKRLLKNNTDSSEWEGFQDEQI